MRIAELVEQLKAHRVIRAVIIYAAFVWALLQAADLFAGEDIIPVNLPSLRCCGQDNCLH